MPYLTGSDVRNVYDHASEAGHGFVASNITELNIAAGLIRGSAAHDSDLVLQVKRDTAAFIGNGDPSVGLDVVGSYVRRLGDAEDIGVFLNVDHIDATDDEWLKTCSRSEYPSSIMVDASFAPFERNVELTKRAVEMTDGDTLVEAELGTVAGEEGGVETESALYTDPEAAVEFVDRTGIDLLAVSIGTEHGVSKGKGLDLRPDLARDISDALADQGLDIPLVVHGSSGLTSDQVNRLLTDTGVCKLNTNTRYQYEFARTACEFYLDNSDAVIPPEGVSDDRTTFFSAAEWAPDKSRFNPQVVCERTRERIATVYGELADVAGSRGESLYA